MPWHDLIPIAEDDFVLCFGIEIFKYLIAEEEKGLPRLTGLP